MLLAEISKISQWEFYADTGDAPSVDALTTLFCIKKGLYLVNQQLQKICGYEEIMNLNLKLICVQEKNSEPKRTFRV